MTDPQASQAVPDRTTDCQDQHARDHRVAITATAALARIHGIIERYVDSRDRDRTGENPSLYRDIYQPVLDMLENALWDIQRAEGGRDDDEDWQDDDFVIVTGIPEDHP